MRGGGQRHVPATWPLGKTRYPLYRRLGGPKGRSGRVRKISPPTGIRSPDRPTCSKSLTDWAIPAHLANFVLYKTVINSSKYSSRKKFMVVLSDLQHYVFMKQVALTSLAENSLPYSRYLTWYQHPTTFFSNHTPESRIYPDRHRELP